MIPKECKRLAEVDFPIAGVSRHAARKESIRHEHRKGTMDENGHDHRHEAQHDTHEPARLRHRHDPRQDRRYDDPPLPLTRRGPGSHNKPRTATRPALTFTALLICWQAMSNRKACPDPVARNYTSTRRTGKTVRKRKQTKQAGQKCGKCPGEVRGFPQDFQV